MAAKWRDQFCNVYLFHKNRVWYMLLGVLGVKESISDDILSIPFHLIHNSE